MNRPLVALAAVTFCFVLWLGSCWLPLPPSNQELLANYAKVVDYAEGVKSVGGWLWWTPSYMEGGSTANIFATILTNLVLYLFSQAGGMEVGSKLAGLFFLTLSPFTMYLLVSRLSRDRWAAFASGVFYLISPSILLRLGYVEHISVVSSMAFLPLAFWGVLSFLEAPSIFHAITCAVAGALLSLAYAKIAVLAFPLLLVFAAWVWIARARVRLPSAPLIAACFGTYVLLAVLFNLPSLREGHLVAQFQLAPFEAWQSSFSTRSAINWIDYLGYLSGDSVPETHRGRDGAFLGLPIILLFGGILLLRRDILTGPGSTPCRLFLAMALVAQWFAFGPNPALLGQWNYLKGAALAPHISIAISWLLLAFQVWLIFFLVPKSLPWRLWIAGVLSAKYLAAPGFRILESIPLFGDLRAPYDIFHTIGVCCVCVAAGLACSLLWRSLPHAAVRSALFLALAATALVSTWAYTRDFRTGRLDQATFTDFQAAQKYLADEKAEGRVLAFSGRYFYLLTPLLSQRGLLMEAFNSYYMLREADQLQKMSLSAPKYTYPYLNFSGATFILLDKLDPDIPTDLPDLYRSRFPVAYENTHFVIFKNAQSLAPAFLAANYATTSDTEIHTAAAACDLFLRNIALIETASPPAEKHPETTVVAGKMNDLSDEKKGQPFTLLSQTAPRLSNYQRISLAGATAPGWAIVPEAFHPDWTATADGKPLEIHRAMTALMAVWLPAGAKSLIYEFRPPFWYGFCADLGLVSWVLVVIFLILATVPVLPARLRKAIHETPPQPVPPSIRQEVRSPVIRPVVILPTYNESDSIHNILAVTFAVPAAVDVLVVDDHSPDGTADLIRNHPEFGKRLHLMERAGKLGLGSAYKEGFQWALQQGYDACLEMDADLSHNPADIPRLLAALDAGADAAIGSRYLKGVRVMNWPEERLLLSSFASKYVRALTRLPLTDATSGFKAVRANALRALDWSKFHAEGYGFQIELHYHLWQDGWTLVEVPIVFTERSEGKTKMSRGIAIEAAFSVLRLAMSKPLNSAGRES